MSMVAGAGKVKGRREDWRLFFEGLLIFIVKTDLKRERETKIFCLLVHPLNDHNSWS